MTLMEQFGPIDIYLFDQILRGNIAPGMKIFDAGCGGGRNLIYFLREGYEVFAVDAEPLAIVEVRRIAADLAPHLTPDDHFLTDMLESMQVPNELAGVVISCAVLHFAHDDATFDAMLRSSWRVLRKGGLFFCRLASSIGMPPEMLQPLDQPRRFLLPDGSQRYLVDEELLMRYSEELGGELVDPLKTSIVQGQRCMTTWVLRKN